MSWRFGDSRIVLYTLFACARESLGAVNLAMEEGYADVGDGSNELCLGLRYLSNGTVREHLDVRHHVFVSSATFSPHRVVGAEETRLEGSRRCRQPAVRQEG